MLFVISTFMSLTNTLEGALPMSIYTVLAGEHKEVSALFTAVLSAPDAMDGAEKSLFHKLYVELLSHAKAEQKTVYDRIEGKISKEEVEEAKRDHAEVEEMLKKIKAMDSASPEWTTEVKTLMRNVQAHVKEEEGVMFKQMQAVFSDEEARDMATQFHEAKKLAADTLR
jgi:hemerythrin superfamily protein